jgi:DNA polymerase-3 subunit delta
MGVYLFHGADEVLVVEAVADKVRELVGDGDRSMLLDEYRDDYVLAAVSEAAQTPPFFSDRRVIAAYQVNKFRADEHEQLAEYIADPAEFTDLVIEWGSGRVAKSIADALKKGGGVSIDPSPPSRAKDRRDWWENEIAASGLRLEQPAYNMLVTWLGEDVSRFSGIAEVLRATYGDERISADDLEPFLGERGDVAPWDLTDAIDAGNVKKALDVSSRMMAAGEKHPLQLMATLHNHFARLAKLDGPDVRSTADAENVLGIKGFPAEKALKAFRNLGSGGVRRAFELLAAADLDLRGATGLDETTVMDVLVARLARLSPRR